MPRFPALSAPALCALALSTSLATAAAAQDSAAIIVSAQRDNATVVVNGGDAGALGNTSAEDLPFPIRSYDESLILNQQPQTLGDVLENDPTIRTTYGFGNAAEQFVIRGFTLFGDDVGLNGLYGIAPRQLVAPQLFDSVQVLNGASAFLNGAAPGGSGLGGSVNLMLKRAGSADLARVTGSFGGTASLGGSVDLARRFGQGGDGGGEWGVRLNAAYHDGETAIDDEDRRTRVIGGAIDYTTARFRAALDLAYQEIRVDNLRPKVTIVTQVVPAVPDMDANYAQDFTYSDLRDVFGTLNLEYDIADNVLAYIRGGARDGHEEGIYGGITVTDAATGAATGNALFVPLTSNNEALEAGVSVTLDEEVSQEINLGGNANWQVTRTAFDFLGGFVPYATNLYYTPTVPLPPSGFVGGNLDDPDPITRTRLTSVFVSDTVGLLDDRVLLTGGLRLQDIRQENIDYDGSPGALYQEDAITPVIGLVLKPLDGLSLYANRIEALQTGPTAPIDRALVNNPGAVLAPRRSVQYEIGGKLRLGGMFFGLGAYTIERPGEGVSADGSFGYLGNQRHRGLEFTANGDLAWGLRLIGGAALTDAELVGGAKVPGVPRFTANADLEWDMAFMPGITLTGRVTHTGRQWIDSANTLELASWTRLDVGARYVLAVANTPVTLRVGVENVANQRYWASAFDAFSAALLQGSPRTAKASLTADF